MTETKFTRELECDLTEDEKQLYGKMLAERTNELTAIEEQKKKVVAEYGSRLKGVRLEQTRLAIARSKGKELRPVECLKRWNNGVIEIVRLDTNEVVDVHPATIADRQVEFPLDDEGSESDEDQAAGALGFFPPSLATPTPPSPPRADAPGWYAGQSPAEILDRMAGESQAAGHYPEIDAHTGELVTSSVGDEVFIGEGMTAEQVANAEALKEALAEREARKGKEKKPRGKKASKSS